MLFMHFFRKALTAKSKLLYQDAEVISLREPEGNRQIDSCFVLTGWLICWTNISFILFIIFCFISQQ